MHLEDYFEFEKFETKFGPAESIRVKGHRIDILYIVEMFNEGMSPERIRQRLPTLSLEKVYATITYYLQHKEKVDEYIAARNKIADAFYQEWLAAPPSPGLQRLRALKAENEAKQAAP